MKNCVFCGGESGATREHIIAEVLQRKMHLEDIEIELGVRSEDGDREFRPAHKFNQLVTRQVCGECNSGWMSRLEVEFVSVVGDLIKPEWPFDASRLLQEAVRRSAVIAHWTLKTAITASMAGVTKRPIPDEITNDVQFGGLPPYYGVQLAHIRKRDFNMISHRGFWLIENDEKRWRSATSGRSFDVLFQLNHLAIRAISAPGVELGIDAPDGRFPIAAFPKAAASLPANYTFDTLDDFEKRLVARIPIGREAA